MTKKRDFSCPNAAGKTSQQGATLVFAVLAISVLVILISLADIGFLHYYKREYQKAADLAAMAGARNLVSEATGERSCGTNAEPAAQGSAEQNLGTKAYQMEVDCGRWNPSSPLPADRVQLDVDDEVLDVVRVRISGMPPRFLPYVPTVTLSATATALADQPLAQLTLRTSLATINSSQSALLDSVVGGFLGGSVNLTAVGGWSGLLGADINLLQYLDALAFELGVSAGDYERVLDAEVGLGVLLDVAAEVLEAGGGTGSINAAVLGLNTLRSFNVPGMGAPLRLADILAVQTGASATALDVGVNLLELVRGSVQTASDGRIAVVDLPVVGVPGFAHLSTQIQVTEPPQLSAMGNPNLVNPTNPRGPGRIYVRSARIRTLVSLNLPLSDVAGLSSAVENVENITNAVTDIVKNLLTLRLDCLLGAPCDRVDVRLVPNAPRVDISLDVGGGEAWVTEHSCSATQKDLTADVRTSVANLRVGILQLDADQPGYVFSSSDTPSVAPLPLIDIGLKECRSIIGLGLTCEDRRPFVGGGIGIMIGGGDGGVLSTSYDDQVFIDPPPLSGEPLYRQFSGQSAVSSLAQTVSGIDLHLYPASSSAELLATPINLVASAFNTVKSLLRPLIRNALSPLLDPLLNYLTRDVLGVNLANAAVGANLECGGGGATLVD